MTNGSSTPRALARGTPHRGKIALTVASDTVRELV